MDNRRSLTQRVFSIRRVLNVARPGVHRVGGESSQLIGLLVEEWGGVCLLGVPGEFRRGAVPVHGRLEVVVVKGQVRECRG